MKQSKLKLIPLIFLLLSGQVHARSWEESMATWAQIWKDVKGDNYARGRQEMEKEHKDRTPQDPNYSYELRKKRFILYAKADVSKNNPIMHTSTYSKLMDWFNSIYEQQTKIQVSSGNATETQILVNESYVMYRYPFKLKELIFNRKLQVKREKEAAAAEARRRAEIMIPALEVKAPVAGFEWVSKHKTFDYLLPCNTGIPYAAIVAHGANRMDLLTDNGEGEFNHERDMSIGYPRMAEFCIVIGVPKSGLSITYNDRNEPEEWRTWWLTEGVEDENGIPVRDEDEEMQATINLLKLAKSALGGLPVYLVVGNDLGLFASKVIKKLGKDGESDVIDGFIYVNRDTGEFVKYGRDSTIWKSSENTPSE
ncbi:hypothetical protein [methanotrophic endosymbiont of Bathymodiolus puteoserpentis (Logatchev)]|uniref:hypothetical protein n=1 Tax=methanotrophic endosymbiont of Bathymodiolus puteoserpentis (Logatchev) TaxID=343235 RepID=UPI00157A69D7|nr:hypothetical protein [methanotrophic endosymbiont of Bathymodiolus puteoserpentis (Logatchev)]